MTDEPRARSGSRSVRPATGCRVGSRRAGLAVARARRHAVLRRHLGLHHAVGAAGPAGADRRRGADRGAQPGLRVDARARLRARRRAAEVRGRRPPPPVPGPGPRRASLPAPRSSCGPRFGRPRPCRPRSDGCRCACRSGSTPARSTSSGSGARTTSCSSPARPPRRPREMEHAAGPGEIVVSGTARRPLPARRRGEAHGPGFALRWRRPGPRPRPGRPPPDGRPDAIASHPACAATAPLRAERRARAPCRLRRFRPLQRRRRAAWRSKDRTSRPSNRRGRDDHPCRGGRRGVTFLGTDIDADGGKVILVTGLPRRRRTTTRAEVLRAAGSPTRPSAAVADRGQPRPRVRRRGRHGPPLDVHGHG